MSEDKETYGKPNCRHEATTPIINLPGMVRCDKCGEVMRPKRTRYEWLRSLTVEKLANELTGLTICAGLDYCNNCEDHDYDCSQCCIEWLMEEVEDA